MKAYLFYCRICGNRFQSKRNDAETCSAKCGTALRLILSPNIISENDNDEYQKNKSDIDNLINKTKR